MKKGTDNQVYQGYSFTTIVVIVALCVLFVSIWFTLPAKIEVAASPGCLEAQSAEMAQWLATNPIPQEIDKQLAQSYKNSYCNLLQAVETVLANNTQQNVQALMSAQDDFVAANSEVWRQAGGYGVMSVPTKQVLEEWIDVMVRAQAPATFRVTADWRAGLESCLQEQLLATSESLGCNQIIFQFSVTDGRTGYVVASETFLQNIGTHEVDHYCPVAFSTATSPEEIGVGFSCPVKRVALRMEEGKTTRYYSLTGLGLLLLEATVPPAE